jgi:multicomponent Na+:H+ antiporter subunit G
MSGEILVGSATEIVGSATGPTGLQAVAVVALVVVGVFFLTVGTIGLLRLPNVYNRMHATSKPTTLGTAAIFLAGFVQFGPGGAGLTSLVGIVFLFLTVPTGAHMISRAAQKTGVPFLSGVTWPAEEADEGGEKAATGAAGDSEADENSDEETS